MEKLCPSFICCYTKTSGSSRLLSDIKKRLVFLDASLYDRVGFHRHCDPVALLVSGHPMQAESVDTVEKTDKELKHKTKEVPTLGCWDELI